MSFGRKENLFTEFSRRASRIRVFDEDSSKNSEEELSECASLVRSTSSLGPFDKTNPL